MNRSMLRNLAALCSVAATAGLAAQAMARPVIYVWKASPGGVHDGTTWNKAYRELYEALSAASSGDQIWVSPGVYKPFPAPNTQSFVLVDGVSVYGSLPVGATSLEQQNLALHTTYLSGDHGNDDPAGVYTENARHVISAKNLSDCRVDGFVIKAGYAMGAAGEWTSGGGAYVSASLVRFVDCRFERNDGKLGGGIYFTNDAAGIISHCEFIDNSAATGGGGAIMIAPGNDNIPASAVVIDRSRFHGNTAVWGGAIDCRGYLELVSSLFSGNSAISDGGAINFQNTAQGSLKIRNVTVAYNTSASGTGGGLSGEFSAGICAIYNSIFWANDAGGCVACPYDTELAPWNMCEVHNCCIEDLDATNEASACDWSDAVFENFSEDPMFKDPAGANGVIGDLDDDFSLEHGSPCVDAGDKNYMPWWFAYDLAGAPRIMRPIVHIPPVPLEIDVGAYEVRPHLFKPVGH